ncbi:hypothetical protein DQ04_00751030 [Trypanosoma grayi]|uniref:hypothetical protein n=1 Tax=Trypanosoma grayi TaxID=71804 RepID=UPI0004F4003B|nr:hypothetical protein DQ04_00751030 [Trypanosoma grayi]KEG13843.1 hypothetical protein DQ04_00751030 [Trypanosoma grayi]
MSAQIPLAGRIARNRQLKLLAAQSRHLSARFNAIFADADVRTTRLNNRHFESSVYYPLSASCSLRLASATAESSAEAVERVHGAALSLLHSTTDLRHMLQAVDSDIFVEFNATLCSMSAKAVVHLLRASDGAASAAASPEAQYMTTVTAELPLTDAETAEMRARGTLNSVSSDIAICRGTGNCPRDAIKTGFALALAELDEYAVEELQSRETEAWNFLRSVQRDAQRRDWGGTFLSAFLSSSLDDSLGGKWWQPFRRESSSARVVALMKEKRRSLTLIATDAMENETRIPLPLHPPPLVFQRVAMGIDHGVTQLQYGLPLSWPGHCVVSSALMQLCAALNVGVSDTNATAHEMTGLTGLEGGSFPAVRAFLDMRGVLPIVVPFSVERGLFIINHLVALRFTAQAESEQRACWSSMPLIRLVFAPSSTKGEPQELHVELGADPPSGEVVSEAYRDFVSGVVRAANKTAVSKWIKKQQQHQRNSMTPGPLVRIWHLFAAAAAVVVSDDRHYKNIFMLFPSLPDFTDGMIPQQQQKEPQQQQQQQRRLLSCIGQLFAADAQLSETALRTGNLPGTLTISSLSLGVEALLLCHVVTTTQEACERLIRTGSPVLADSEKNTDPQRAVVDAARGRESEQSAYYCPDLVLMIQEMRLALHLPQRSFPTLEFFQRATHDVPKRVQELAVGLHGDVPVYTRVVAHWGPNLRVEVESGSKSAGEDGGVFRFDMQQSYHDEEKQPPPHFEGPLRLLLSVVRSMYKRVFPHRTTVPVIALNSPTRRRAIDFLMYSWFMAPSQVRCFEISTRAARLTAATSAVSQNHLDAAESALSHYIDNHIIRAMLFYDFCGQRVLFAETHAPTLGEAVRRVNELAVSLNIPTQDHFPPRPELQRSSRCLSASPGGADSELSVLLDALVGVTHAQAKVYFVQTNDPTSPCVEGAVEVRVPFRQIRCAAAVTKARGVIPALAVACGEALRHAGRTEEEVAVTLQTAVNAAPLLPRDDFPHFSARFYTPANLLGEVLQGVAAKYYCEYTVDARSREVVCLLYVAALAKYENAALGAAQFPLGVGRGRNKRTAWAAAALQALRANFPDVLLQMERHKALCALLHRPDDLARLGCHTGFTLTVTPNEGASSGYCCTVTPRQARQAAENPAEKPTGLLVHHANRGVDAYIHAADALLDRMRRCREEKGGEDGGFALWDSTTNYGKSLWHACCGALGAAWGGKVCLRFEGGREVAVEQESELPMRVRLFARTWVSSENRTVETVLLALENQRIMDYSGLIGSHDEGRPSAEQILFASTRLLAEAIEKYTDEHTRRELQQLLRLLQQLKEEGLHCSRLNAKRRVESCIELTLGCQCRVVTQHAAAAVGRVTAQAGVWLPGQSRETRVPIVIACFNADTTESALLGLEHNVHRIVDSLWATILQVPGR